MQTNKALIYSYADSYISIYYQNSCVIKQPKSYQHAQIQDK